MTICLVERGPPISLDEEGKQVIKYETNINEYIAHIRDVDNSIQTVSEHLEGVRQGCEAFGSQIGVTHLAGLAGLLHDLGKNTEVFKKYIIEATSHPDNPPRRGSVDHSTAGGRFIYRRYHQKSTDGNEKLAAEWIANCIISHHQGLRDYLDADANAPFFERVAKKTDGMEEYETAETAFLAGWAPEKLDRYFTAAQQEVALARGIIRKNGLRPAITSALLIKYLFSCLIDADRTDTRQFEEGHCEPWTTDYRDFFARSYDKLMNEMRSYEDGVEAEHPINKLRRDMSQQCEDFADRGSGIYTLSIPTGGGKTLSSLRYALKHALLHGKERIIYVVPYMTIIEQNAKRIRDILQEDDLVLEHHSNVMEDLDSDGSEYNLYKKRLGLAHDNWDRPLIFTTMVQFLNTFYAKGTRNVRRLHRLSNAVLIFDEVQAVPPNCVSLFNVAVNFLSVFGQSTAVLCTATQPSLEFVRNNLKMSAGAEIISNLNEVAEPFKRVTVEDLTAIPMEGSELAQFIEERLREVDRVLVILNTKSEVRKLFSHLDNRPGIKENGVQLFHLSTNMCAAHRNEVLQKTKDALGAKMPLVCVSTQLIEAGVDISFDCVIRSLAGLDSIAQAAGRCNRHGRDPLRKVYVIQSADEVLTHLPEIRTRADVTLLVLNEFAQAPERFGNDLLSSSAMTTYFRYYFDRIRGELDYPILESGQSLFELLNKNKSLFDGYCRRYGRQPEILSRPSFASAERHFHVIHNSGKPVLVPWNEDARELLVKLNGEVEPKDLSRLLRQSQQYVVDLYDHDIHTLDRNGDIFPLLHGHVLALRESAYSEEFGVEIEGKGRLPWEGA